MKTVGIRELKNRLSLYLRMVRAGERVVVTDRGEVVAELRPPDPSAEHVDVDPGLLELVRRHGARLGAPNRPELYEDRPVRTPEGTALRLLDEDRGER